MKKVISLVGCLLLVSCSIDSLSVNTNKNSINYDKESGTSITHSGANASATISIKGMNENDSAKTTP